MFLTYLNSKPRDGRFPILSIGGLKLLLVMLKIAEFFEKIEDFVSTFIRQIVVNKNWFDVSRQVAERSFSKNIITNKKSETVTPECRAKDNSHLKNIRLVPY